MRSYLFFWGLTLFPFLATAQQRDILRSRGLQTGVLKPGKENAITDVEGVLVGQVTLIKGDSVRTGVTAILPHSGNIFQQKAPAAVYVGNGFGKLAGATQVMELGNLETPVVLTNTLGVPVAMNAVIHHTLRQPGNENVQSVNAVVGETNDGWLNDIRGQHVKEEDVLKAIQTAASGPVAEGSVGAGTGTSCFGFKGGIGTASRKLPASLGGYTVGVLVQTNFGGVLQIDGVPVGKELKQFDYSSKILQDVDGSCMIVVATDAPLDSRNLGRLAKRAFMGLARTGGIASNGSGDYVIAFSTATQLRVSHQSEPLTTPQVFVSNDAVSPLFMAAIEAAEEAILNSLFMAKSVKGFKGHEMNAIPKSQVLELLRRYNRLPPGK
ncbi:MAG: P1 family peptidase [Flavihumibacter sp.]